MSLLARQFRGWLQQAYAYHFAQVGAMQRASAARAMGLDPEKYGEPFPGSSSTVLVMSAPPLPEQPPAPAAPGETAGASPRQGAPVPPPYLPPATRGLPRWAPWALSAGLALVTGGGGAGLVALLRPTPTVSPVVTPSPATAPAMDRVYEWSIGPDGKWRTTTRDVPHDAP